MVSSGVGRRFLTTAASVSLNTNCRMSAWQLSSYSKSPGLVLNSIARIPTIERPTDVLIEVHAASVNPLDCQMSGGFGRTVIGVLRQLDERRLTPVSEFPVTLGRDCSGIVVGTGRKVTRFKPGDEVWCAIAAHRQGTFAEYVAVDNCYVAKKPKNLSHVEAASMPYVACTVWSALRYAARMNRDALGTNVLVHGSAGGIGTFAVQLLNNWGATVIATCRSDAHEMVRELGAADVVDYTAPDAWDHLSRNGPYDVIFDPVFNTFSQRSKELLKTWRGSTYVSITNPLLENCDRRGLVVGMLASASIFSTEFLRNLGSGRIYTWAYVVPDGRVLEEVSRLVDDGKIRPVVEKVFPFIDLPSAVEKVARGRARGKVVVEVRPKPR